jgi:excisionase family DNA binding protein
MARSRKKGKTAKQVEDMHNSNPPSLLTIKEAAHLLHVHPNTVRRWHDMGLLSGYRVGPRGDRRFKLAEMERFLTGEGGT